MKADKEGLSDMVDYTQKEQYTLEDLREIVHILRHEGGCPWDQEQTHASIRRDLMEETCELIEAINQESAAGMKEELGDVLMQVVFHADMEEDAGRFDLDGVADGIAKKMIYRHPHVFGEVTVSGTGEALSNWEKLKRREKGQDTCAAAMDAVARTLPALWRAEKVQKKASKAGFDWADTGEAVEKVTEAAGEVQEAVCAGESRERVAGELGNLLFAAVNAARFIGRDPEELLHAATDQFIRRFARVEAMAGEQDLHDITSEELVKLWKRAKEETEV